jgi:hypothetical protein
LSDRAQTVVGVRGFGHKTGAGWAKWSLCLHNMYNSAGFGIGVWRCIVLYSHSHILLCYFGRLRCGTPLRTVGMGSEMMHGNILGKDVLKRTSGAENIY